MMAVEAQKKMIAGLWDKACRGYNSQQVDPDVLEEFAVLIAKKCLSLNSETIAMLKADESIDVPGAATFLNLVRAECRNRIRDEFNID